MTKADEMNISNLMENLRKMDNLRVNSGQSEEAERIRKFCIDAVTDYNETVKKLCELINANKDLWQNPYIKGSYSGYDDCGEFVITSDYVRPHGTFHFTKGSFTIQGEDYWKTAICAVVDGIKGTKERTGYCGAWEDHGLDKSGWNAVSVGVINTRGTYSEKHPWENDLIEDIFDYEGKKHKYSVENLKNFNWGVEGWNTLKAKAERTRIRTQELVNRFKRCLEERIKVNTEKMNTFSTASESVYIKVQF